MNPAMKKSIILFVFIMLQATLPSAAQKMSFKFNDVSLSEALRQIDHAQSDKHIVFMFDDLDMFLVNADLHGLSVAEAVHKVCDSHPVTVTDVGDAIFVEYVPKVVHLSPVVIYGENDAKQLSDDSLSVPSGDSSKRRGVHRGKRGYYCSPSLAEAQPMTMPVVAPYTDIRGMLNSDIDLSHNDSLTRIAHDVLSMKLESLDDLSFRLIEIDDAEAYRSVVQQWAEACRTADDISEVAVPQPLLDLMAKVKEPFLMFVLQDGFERGQGENRSAGFDYKSLIAEASSGKTAYYNRYVSWTDVNGYAKGIKPTSEQYTESAIHYMMKDYPDRKTSASYTFDKQLRVLISVNLSAGSLYPLSLPGYIEKSKETVKGIDVNYLFRMGKTPFFAGLEVMNLSSFNKLLGTDGHKHSDEVVYWGPVLAYNKVLGMRHSLTFSLGLNYSAELSWFQEPDGLATGYREKGWNSNASLMYHYRLNAYNALGIGMNVQSFQHLSPFSVFNSPIDYGTISVSYMFTQPRIITK